MSDRAAAAVSQCSQRTVRRARTEHVAAAPHDKQLLFSVSHPHVSRIPAPEREAVAAWIGEKCPCKSGSKYHIQRCTSETLYNEYKDAIASGELAWAPAGSEPRARARWVFDAMKAALHIRRARNYSGNFECRLCTTLPADEKALRVARAKWQKASDAKDEKKAGTLWLDVQAAERRVAKKTEHKALFLHQAAYLHHVRHTATKEDRSRVLVVMDFSRYDMLLPVGEKKEEEWMHDLVVVVEWWATVEHPRPASTATTKVPRKDKGEQRCIIYVDNLCVTPGIEKNDTEYVRVVLRRIIERGLLAGFRRVDLFTDGGGKHFKNVYSMDMASQWQEMWQQQYGAGLAAPELVWNVTAPYHGHGMADSHAGSVSQRLTRVQLGRQHTEGLAATPPSTVEEFAKFINEMKGCAPESFDVIARPPVRLDMESLQQGIKKFYQFTFVSTTTHSPTQPLPPPPFIHLVG